MGLPNAASGGHTFAHCHGTIWTACSSGTTPSSPCCEGSSAYGEPLALRATVAASLPTLFHLFVRLRLPVILPDPDGEGDATVILSGDEPTAAFERALRLAVALVTSRAFELGELGACNLVPLLDMCNSATCTSDAHPFLYEADADAVVLRASSVLRRGVEIEDHYGVSSNAGLLVFFGYLVMDGPLETRGVRLELSLDASDPLHPWKRRILRQRGLGGGPDGSDGAQAANGAAPGAVEACGGRRRRERELRGFPARRGAAGRVQGLPSIGGGPAGTDAHARLEASDTPWDVLEGRFSIFDDLADEEAFLGAELERGAASRLHSALTQAVRRYARMSDGDASCMASSAVAQPLDEEQVVDPKRERLARALVSRAPSPHSTTAGLWLCSRGGGPLARSPISVTSQAACGRQRNDQAHIDWALLTYPKE